MKLEAARCLSVVAPGYLSVGVVALWSEEYWLGLGFAEGNMAHKASDQYEFYLKRDS